MTSPGFRDRGWKTVVSRTIINHRDRSPRPSLILCIVIFAVIAAVSVIPSASAAEAQADDKSSLTLILSKAEKYCRRLGNAALDYVCLEEIEEKSLDTIQDSTGSRFNRIVERQVWVKHSYIYDYQFIRKDGRLVEKRVLLEEDGRKPGEEETRLKTRTFAFQNVMFGPINFLDEDRQFLFDYGLEGSEMVNGESAVILKAVPKPDVDTKLPWGRVWISKKYYTILKIEWSQDAMSRAEIIKKRAKRMKSRPQISQITEFAFEKNGLRFPSRYFIEEAYINKRNKKVVLSRLDVVYKDYKFFTVETDIKY